MAARARSCRCACRCRSRPGPGRRTRSARPAAASGAGPARGTRARGRARPPRAPAALSGVSTGSPERSKTASAPTLRASSRSAADVRPERHVAAVVRARVGEHVGAAPSPRRRRTARAAISCSAARRSSASRTTRGWCSPSMSAITLIDGRRCAARSAAPRRGRAFSYSCVVARELDDRLLPVERVLAIDPHPLRVRSRSRCNRGGCARAAAASRPCRS